MINTRAVAAQDGDKFPFFIKIALLHRDVVGLLGVKLEIAGSQEFSVLVRFHIGPEVDAPVGTDTIKFVLAGLDDKAAGAGSFGRFVPFDFFLVQIIGWTIRRYPLAVDNYTQIAVQVVHPLRHVAFLYDEVHFTRALVL